MTPLNALLDELGILLADLIQLLFDGFLEAAAALLVPFKFYAVLSDLPTRFANRIGQFPSQLVFRVIDLFPAPKTALASRVVRADQVLAAMMDITGRAIADLTGNVPEGRLRRGILLAEQKSLTHRLEDAIGKRFLSRQEKLTQRLLKLVSSPLRLFRLLLRIITSFYNLTVAGLGGFFIIWFFRYLTSEAGQEVVRRYCLGQQNPRVGITEFEVEDGIPTRYKQSSRRVRPSEL